MHDHKGWHSRGYLPHFDSPQKTQHVVFRTSGRLPKTVVASLPKEVSARRKEIDAALDRCDGVRPLASPDAASIVQTALLHFDGKRYGLLAWCIMPNHVHVVCELFDGFALGSVIRSWKAYTGAQINRMQSERGAFWAPDYFDRYIRNERDLARTIDYVERNPVSAGLAASPAEWPWSSAGGTLRA